MNRLYGISAKLSRSAKKDKESVCLNICPCDKRKPRKERVERITDHRKATYKMISYAYRMCAVFETIGVDFEEPADLEWHTIAMFISKYEETYKDIMDEIKSLRERQRSVYDDIDFEVCSKMEDYGASW